MKKNFIHILPLMALLALPACSSEDDIATAETAAGEGVQMGFTIQVAGSSQSRGAAGEGQDESIEEGIDRENMIDVANRDFRVYLFKAAKPAMSENLGELEILSTNTVEGGYYVTGKLSEDQKKNLADSDFRLVVMANLAKWYKYDGNNGVLGAYPTMEDDARIGIREGNDIQLGTDPIFWYRGIDSKGEPYSYGNIKFGFNVLSKFGDARLIPMWGIQTYTDRFTDGQITDLKQPVKMLRALAKIEVIIDRKILPDMNKNDTQGDGEDMVKVLLRNFKETAVIEPYNCSLEDEGENTKSSYQFQGFNTYTDFALANTISQGVLDGKRLKLRWVNAEEFNAEGSTADAKFAVYVPEMNETGWNNFQGGGGYPQLQLVFNGKEDEQPYIIPLRAPGENGKFSKVIPILRNHIYRYRITQASGGMDIYYDFAVMGESNNKIEFGDTENKNK